MKILIEDNIYLKDVGSQCAFGTFSERVNKKGEKVITFNNKFDEWYDTIDIAMEHYFRRKEIKSDATSWLEVKEIMKANSKLLKKFLEELKGEQ